MLPRPRSLPSFALAALALAGSLPALARDNAEPAPQWAVDAAKTPTPANVGDAPAVILFDEYLITVDVQNHAVERYSSTSLRIAAPVSSSSLIAREYHPQPI